MKTVSLHGELGKRFGRTHKFSVKSVAEAIRALCANFPEFDKFMIESGNRGVGFKVVTGKHELEALSEVKNPVGRANIKIVPVLSGGGAKLKIFVGVALIAASFFTGGATLLPGLTLAGFTAAVGLSLVLGGVSQMLAGNPDSDGPKERPEDNPSYLFNGAVNTTAQGHPVPIGYGRLIVGSAVISAGLSIEDISPSLVELNTADIPAIDFTK